jgi:hypothetical protein
VRPAQQTAKCRRPSCRAWSWELAQGKPCPYCLRVDLVVRFWVWVNRAAVMASLVALAGLAYMALS